MRLLLRLLTPLLGLALAAAGLLLVVEVVGAWFGPAARTGLLAPWPQWRQAVENQTWAEHPVPLIASGVAVVGLLLLLLGLMARRTDVALIAPSEEITVTTSPRVLARLVGRRVRADRDVVEASVTASRNRVSVTAEGWSSDPDPALVPAVEATVQGLLDELPLQKRPRVVVRVTERRGKR